VIDIHSIRYTPKNMKVRPMMHSNVGESSGVYSGPFGCSIMITDTITAEKPPYKPISANHRRIVRIVEQQTFLISKVISPSQEPFRAFPPKQNGTNTTRNV
jgi:hypothetical protein